MTPGSPHDPFGRSRLVPAVASREYRVALLLEAAGRLQNSRHEADLFLGDAVAAWLKTGGSLERDHLSVGAGRGSHRTPSAIARRIVIHVKPAGAEPSGPGLRMDLGTLADPEK